MLLVDFHHKTNFFENVKQSYIRNENKLIDQILIEI